jgi:hypothetical protein
MRLDLGMRQPPKVEMNEHPRDETRDDTKGSERPIDLNSKIKTTVTIENESKPLFRTTSPKVEYAASSPYYDVLEYSFTPEQAQKQKLSARTSSRTSKQLTTSGVDKSVNAESASTNTNTKLGHGQLKETSTTVPTTNDHDKIGDGDQSPIYDSYLHKVYLELFRTGKCVKCRFLVHPCSGYS